MVKIIVTYQTLIVGCLGFAGVIVTMLWNARLQRQQEERRERRDANALRTALIEELKQQREALRVTAESLADDALKQHPEDEWHSTVPLERFDAVFRGSLERLGLLERPEVSAVFEAY